MPSNKAQAGKKLRKLSQYLRRGWQRQHPVPPSVMESVREVVRQQWEMEHQVMQKPPGAQQLEQAKRAHGHKRTPPSQSHDYGHSH